MRTTGVVPTAMLAVLAVGILPPLFSAQEMNEEIALTMWRVELTKPTTDEPSRSGRPEDEIYALVVGRFWDETGRLKAETYANRLPSGNRDVWPSGHPGSRDAIREWDCTLWSGSLAPGERAEFVVKLLEQDDGALGPDDAKAALDGILAAIGDDGVIDGTASAVASTIGGASASGHDPICTFSVDLRNDGGSLAASFAPLHDAIVRGRRYFGAGGVRLGSRADVVGTGSGSQYLFTMKVHD